MITDNGRRDQRWARRSLLTYFIVLLPLSLLGYWLWIARGQHQALIFVPATSAIITRVLRREGFGDVSFRIRGGAVGSALAYALILPLGVCIAAYGSAWIIGLVGFGPARLPWPFANLGNSYAHFVWTILLSLTVVTAFFLPLAAGEEIGWRGHMLPRLVAAEVPRPEMTSAIIWALWHVPLILFGSYLPGAGQPILASLLFIVVASLFGIFLARLRLASGSIWPPVLAHAAWNALTQACFNPAVHPGPWPWLGESGILIALCLAGAVVLHKAAPFGRGSTA